MEIEIVKAKIEDLPQILELQILCYQENAKRYNDFHISPLMQTLEELESEFQKSLILKAVEKGKIIGSIRGHCSNDTCQIGRVIVHPDSQNRGLGHQLMREMENCFPHVLKYQLFTGFKDEKNLYLYKKLGYVPFKTESLGKDFSFIYLEKNNKASTQHKPD